VGDELVLLSWNIEKKSLATFLNEADTADLIAQGLTNAIGRAGCSATDPPFVAFLQELKGPKADLEQVGRMLQQSFTKLGSAPVEFEVVPLGGGTYTDESIITLSRGVDIRSSELDIRSQLDAYIEADQRQALAAQQDYDARRAGKNRGKNKYESRTVDSFRRNTKDVEWFRNGVSSEIRIGGKSLRVASAHAPGPDFVKDFPESVDATVNAAKNANTDVLLGDFNRHGDYAEDSFIDLHKMTREPTTLSRSGLKRGRLESGSSRLDRVFESRDYQFWAFEPQPPYLFGRDPLSPRLADHQIMSLRARPKGREAYFGDFAPLMSKDQWREIGINLDEESNIFEIEPELAGGEDFGFKRFRSIDYESDYDTFDYDLDIGTNNNNFHNDSDYDSFDLEPLSHFSPQQPATTGDPFRAGGSSNSADASPFDMPNPGNQSDQDYDDGIMSDPPDEEMNEDAASLSEDADAIEMDEEGEALANLAELSETIDAADLLLLLAA
jgi:hypothetical protein